ncbi:MAG TPA: hypothetical protein ENJ73_03255 [Desulfobacterales bacterium]|nr:hypothetical protein [Desulfobacterales bacterium]
MVAKRRARLARWLGGWWMLLIGASAPLAWAAGPSAAAPPAPKENAAEILRQILGAEDLFFYRAEGRRDPFMPFIREKVVEQEVRAEEEDIPEEKLTGLRRFEPGQLTLVAIVQGAAGPVAMVQDPVGKGYIIRPGTLIGRYGVVEKITGGRVIVKQRTASTWTREKLFKRVEMVLPKEGER